jgi:hypothetical protein
MSNATMIPPGLRGRTIDIQRLPREASFLRILGVNYVHLKTPDDGDLYLTEYGVPFLQHLMPENWYEETWFSQKRERLAGTSTVYRVPTRPLKGYLRPSIDLVVKWSRVGEDVPLDTFTLDKTINAEFNTPFEEFSLVEELREGLHGPEDLSILMQKPMAIYAPPEKMQLWQTGRSKEKILQKVARHPGIEIDILRSYILLYQWLRGQNVLETLAASPLGESAIQKQAWELTEEGNRELEKKGYRVADNKPTHLILRTRNGEIRKRRDGRLLYGLIDYELLSRTAAHEEEVKQRQRARYLHFQRNRFVEPEGVEWPPDLQRAEVLDVPYIWGRSESTGGALWVVGKNPELFSYFLPEKWRFKQVRLSERRQTYYTQTKDRIHLVWQVSRVGELPTEEMASGPEHLEQLTRHGYNCPFEEFAIALDLGRRGIATTYPRAIYMTGKELLLPNRVIDERRYDKYREVVGPDGSPVLRLDRDFIVIWGYWRGLSDFDAPVDNQLWSPIDVARAAVKGIISKAEHDYILNVQRQRLAAAGYEDVSLGGTHILISYIPDGAVKRTMDGAFELRQCNFETLRRIDRQPVAHSL